MTHEGTRRHHRRHVASSHDEKLFLHDLEHSLSRQCVDDGEFRRQESRPNKAIIQCGRAAARSASAALGPSLPRSLLRSSTRFPLPNQLFLEPGLYTARVPNTIM